jgi:hypothetical protein
MKALLSRRCGTRWQRAAPVGLAQASASYQPVVADDGEDGAEAAILGLCHGTGQQLSPKFRETDHDGSPKLTC